MYDCQYCDEFERGSLEIRGQNFGNRLLFKSNNFVVFPSLGQIVEGYLLIASNEHYVGIGDIPQELYSELENVCQKVRKVLSDTYGNPLFFEHGPISQVRKGGCCIEHPHVHAVPVQMDILDDLAKHFEYKKIYSFDSLKKQFRKEVPYFYYESNLGERYLFEVPQIVPSQYIRRIIACKIDKPERGDWRNYFGLSELHRTIDKLKNKF